jgi:hypothetical protein
MLYLLGTILYLLRSAMAVPRATVLLTAGVEMPSRLAMAVILSPIARTAQ